MCIEVREIKEKYNYDFRSLLINENTNEEEKNKINIQIENIVETLYEKLISHDRKINETQKNNSWVPILSIAQHFGFDTRQVFLSQLEYNSNEEKKDAQNISGFISIDPNNKTRYHYHSDKVMFINFDNSDGHCRFTVAHELGHYLFDFNETKDTEYINTYRLDDYINPIEIRANRFAAALLMPKDKFINEYEISKMKKLTLYDLVCYLSEYFLVSPTAVKRRINELKELDLLKD